MGVTRSEPIALERVLRHRAFIAIAGVLTGVLLAVAVPRIDGTDQQRVEIGETFEATVKSYFDDSGPEPHVICFERGDDTCGLPLFGEEVPPALAAGDRVRATEVWLRDEEGTGRLAFYVQPLG